MYRTAHSFQTSQRARKPQHELNQRVDCVQRRRLTAHVLQPCLPLSHMFKKTFSKNFLHRADVLLKIKEFSQIAEEEVLVKNCIVTLLNSLNSHCNIAQTRFNSQSQKWMFQKKHGLLHRFPLSAVQQMKQSQLTCRATHINIRSMINILLPTHLTWEASSAAEIQPWTWK